MYVSSLLSHVSHLSLPYFSSHRSSPSLSLPPSLPPSLIALSHTHLFHLPLFSPLSLSFISLSLPSLLSFLFHSSYLEKERKVECERREVCVCEREINQKRWREGEGNKVMRDRGRGGRKGRECGREMREGGMDRERQGGGEIEAPLPLSLTPSLITPPYSTCPSLPPTTSLTNSSPLPSPTRSC